MVVMPGVFKPASIIADLTCAEATFISCVIGIGYSAPLTSIGRNSESLNLKFAPKSTRGSITLFIGL